MSVAESNQADTGYFLVNLTKQLLSFVNKVENEMKNTLGPQNLGSMVSGTKYFIS